MKMTQKQLEQVVAVLTDNVSEYTIHTDYSGRGMFGKTTLAVSVNGEEDRELAIGAADLLVRWDTFGKNRYIIY